MQFGVANPLSYLDDIHTLDGAFFDEPLVLPTATIRPTFAPTTPTPTPTPTTTTTTTTPTTKMPLLFPTPSLTTSFNDLPPLPNYQVPQVHQVTPIKKRELDGNIYYPPKKVQHVLPRPPNPPKVDHQNWSSSSLSSDNNDTTTTVTNKNNVNPTDSSSSSSSSDVLEEQRKERNRKHAKRSRQRRKSLTEDLQQSLNSLKAENSKLRQALYARLGNDQKPIIDSMVESKISKPTEEFIQELKNFRQHALDNKTRTYLKSLSKTATKCADEFRNNMDDLFLDEDSYSS